MKRSLSVTAAAALLALGSLSACSSSDDDSSGGPASFGSGVPVVAKDIEFDKETYEADAGEVTIDLRNDGVLEHNLLIEGVDGFELEVPAKGDTDSGSTTLEAGEYVIFCDVVGHREAGMESTLKVS